MAKDKKQKVKVLYQNLNGVWYAFANVGDEVYFSPVNLKQKSPSEKKTTRKSSSKPGKEAA